MNGEKNQGSQNLQWKQTSSEGSWTLGSGLSVCVWIWGCRWEQHSTDTDQNIYTHFAQVTVSLETEWHFLFPSGSYYKLQGF